jgi:hypothetical protein
MMAFLFALPELGWKKYEPICVTPCDGNWADPKNETKCYIEYDKFANVTDYKEDLNTTFLGGCENHKKIVAHNHHVSKHGVS